MVVLGTALTRSESRTIHGRNAGLWPGPAQCPTSEVACVKEALVQLGQISSSRARPPAVDVTEEHRAHIRHALAAAGLLEKERA